LFGNKNATSGEQAASRAFLVFSATILLAGGVTAHSIVR